MQFLLSSMSMVYVLTTPMPEDGGENLTVKQVKKRAKWDNDDHVCRGLILNGMSDSLFDVYQNVETSKELWDTFEAKYMAEDASSKKFLVSCIIDKLPPSWKDFKHTLKYLKEELTLIEFGSHLRIEESLKAQESDKPKGKKVAGPSVVNMVKHNNSSRYNDNKGIAKLAMLATEPIDQEQKDDDVAWWVGSGATVHVCKDRCWFKTYEPIYDGSILYIGNESTALVHRRGCVDLRFSSRKVVCLLNALHVSNIWKNLVSSGVLNHYGYKQVIESNKFVLSKHGVFIGFGYLSNHMFRPSCQPYKLNDSILWYARLGHVYFKRMQDMSKDELISAFDMDTERCKTCMMTKINKKPFQNVKYKTEVLELIHSDLHATPSFRNKKYFVTFI
ncbi:zinc finger, CCHC-type containing protein, partial [Tanacetum coccineum]